MGKATVVSGGVDGAYQIKLDYGKAARDKRVNQLSLEKASYIAEITRLSDLLDVQELAEDAARVKTEAAVSDYVAAGAALQPALVAIDDAQEAFTAAQQANYPSPEDRSEAVAAAQAALAAARAVYQEALADMKTTLDAHTKALTELVAQKQITAGLRLQLSVPAGEQVAIIKEIARLTALVLEETRQAWCMDLTQDAKGEVATVEIPGEGKLVLIAPEAPAPVAADGVLSAREMQSPEQVFWNAAVLPGWQKYKPTYRRGTITAINEAADTADVLLSVADTSSAQNLVINQTPTLSAVPVKYMDCHALAFVVGDKCVVKFTDQDWLKPKVVGFVDNPKPCNMPISGIVRGGSIVTLPVPPGSPVGTVAKKALHSLNPTSQAWQYPLRSDSSKSPGAYHDETGLGRAGAQYAQINASMYSGQMAKAVQVILARGTVVQYGSTASWCHGVVTASDGEPWLVEISEPNGVIAMRLPVDKAPSSSPQDVVRECLALWRGIPNGKAMPSGASLAAALSAGTVIRLATVGDLQPYHGKRAHSQYVGWSFNNAGTEAHNTCWSPGPGVHASYHYKLAISIGALVSDPAPGVPVATGTATLSLVASGPLYTIDTQTPFHFSDANGAVFESEGGTPVTADVAPNVEAPVFVCHINNVLETVKVKYQKIVSVLANATGSALQYVVSTTFPYDGGAWTGSGDMEHGQSGTLPHPGGIYESLRTVAIFPAGMRDGYVHFQNGTAVTSAPPQSFLYYGSVTKAVVTVLTPSGQRHEQDILGSDTYLRGTGSPGWEDSDINSYTFTQWDDQEFMWLYPQGQGAVFFARVSVFGASPQAEFSRDITGSETVLKGGRVDSEPKPATERYNFLGYL